MGGTIAHADGHLLDTVFGLFQIPTRPEIPALLYRRSFALVGVTHIESALICVGMFEMIDNQKLDRSSFFLQLQPELGS